MRYCLVLWWIILNSFLNFISEIKTNIDKYDYLLHYKKYVFKNHTCISCRLSSFFLICVYAWICVEVFCFPFFLFPPSMFLVLIILRLTSAGDSSLGTALVISRSLFTIF